MQRQATQTTQSPAPVPAPAAGRGRGPSTGSGQVPATAAQAFRDKLEEFYAAEGVVATFDRGSDSDMADGGSTLSWQQQHPDGGTIFPSGSFARDDKVGKSVPGLTIAVEHYNRMIRVLELLSAGASRGRSSLPFAAIVSHSFGAMPSELLCASIASFSAASTSRR